MRSGICAAAILLVVSAPLVAGDNPPRIDYMLNCMGCHMEDGRGTGQMVPELKNFAGKFLHVEGGREFLIQVPGVAQAALDDEDLADVMNWLLNEFSSQDLPENFRPYSPQEVGELRKNKLINVATRRAELVSKME